MAEQAREPHLGAQRPRGVVGPNIALWIRPKAKLLELGQGAGVSVSPFVILPQHLQEGWAGQGETAGHLLGG